eukprot:1886341-Rhodomonas_salina.1
MLEREYRSYVIELDRLWVETPPVTVQTPSDVRPAALAHWREVSETHKVSEFPVLESLVMKLKAWRPKPFPTTETLMLPVLGVFCLSKPLTVLASNVRAKLALPVRIPAVSTSDWLLLFGPCCDRQSTELSENQSLMRTEVWPILEAGELSDRPRSLP